ncbi:hypothetical protein EVAR_84991_1 [Eumeta japonica]|uniref:Uncharacterized protein n=1 Tax=Eumeta variegata TaxID=151549 RepID=A0A4C1WA53_EUMVA|nr:hypothetical protein EVAR_84991_1 [Eumeta japonica]
MSRSCNDSFSPHDTYILNKVITERHNTHQCSAQSDEYVAREYAVRGLGSRTGAGAHRSAHIYVLPLSRWGRSYPMHKNTLSASLVHVFRVVQFKHTLAQIWLSFKKNGLPGGPERREKSRKLFVQENPLNTNYCTRTFRHHEDVAEVTVGLPLGLVTVGLPLGPVTEHIKELARTVKYHTLTEYGLEVVASAFAFCSASGSSGGLPFLISPFHRPDPPLSCIMFLLQETENTLLNAAMHTSMGGGDDLLSDG